MAVREEKITLEPMDLFWGRRQKDTITFVNDTAGSEAGKYFTIGDADYFWLDDGIVSDPTPGGAFVNSNAISYSQGDDAATIAAAAALAVDAVVGFNAASSLAEMTYEQDEAGAVTGLVDGDTGYVITNVITGDGRDLGGSGPVEVSFSVDATDIQATQLGTQILDQVVTATNLELSMELLELTKENWDLILGEVIGDKKTVGLDELTGLGESKRFKNMSQFSRELRLKPVGSSDDSRNLHFWKVYPIIDNVNYAGDDISKMSLTWRALRDTNKDDKVNLMVFGDGKVNLL
jgi:hypothetical protein